MYGQGPGSSLAHVTVLCKNENVYFLNESYLFLSRFLLLIKGDACTGRDPAQASAMFLKKNFRYLSFSLVYLSHLMIRGVYGPLGGHLSPPAALYQLQRSLILHQSTSN